MLYCNRLQLATETALYSDGEKYRPARMIAAALGSKIKDIETVLLLGSGVGSMIRVLKEAGHAPEYTLVEYDKVVLRWALELLQDEAVPIAEAVCADAARYMQENTARYDLIFADIFTDMVVPAFVTEREFLQQCFNSLNKGGHLAINYIVNEQAEWHALLANMATIFPGFKQESNGVNFVLTGQRTT